MPRFLKVKGVSGHLVPDPRATGSLNARYIGLRPIKDPPVGARKHELYEPYEQVVPDDIATGATARRAAERGDLLLLKVEVAASLDKAFVAPLPAVKPKKGE